jgi:hypothetical protein
MKRSVGVIIAAVLIWGLLELLWILIITQINKVFSYFWTMVIWIAPGLIFAVLILLFAGRNHKRRNWLRPRDNAE